MPVTRFRPIVRAGLVVVIPVSVTAFWLAAGELRSDIRVLALLLAATYAAGLLAYLCATRQPLGTALANGVVSTLALVLVLGLFELPAVLGVVDYRLVLPPSRHLGFTRIKPWADPRNVLDPELIYTRAPESHLTGETIGDLVYWLGITTDRRYPLDVRYDRRGFRNARDLDTAAIVLVGDSFLEAGLIPESDSLSSRLRDRLGVPVANLGLSGYGPQQALAAIRRYGLALRPRLVIWFFFEGNDLLDVRRYEELTRDWQTTVGTYHGFRERAFSTNVLRHLADLVVVPPPEDRPDARTRSCTLDVPRNRSTETLYFAYPGEPLSSEDLRALGVAEALIGSGQHLVCESNGEFLLVFVPTKFRVYYGQCRFPADALAGRWQPNDLPERMAAWSGAHNVAFVDLTPPLRDAAARGELVYFPDDGHWNAAGVAVAADVLSAWICRSGVLPSDESSCHP